MTHKDWERFNNAQNCHICNEGLVKLGILDSIGAWDKDTGKFSGKSHKKCRRSALCTDVEVEVDGILLKSTFHFIRPKMERKRKDPTDKWIEETQADCMFCGNPLLQTNFRDAVKDHCHVSGCFCGAAQAECVFFAL